MRPRPLVGTTAACGLLATVLVGTISFVQFAHPSVSLRVAIGTAAALIALLGARLVFAWSRKRAHDHVRAAVLEERRRLARDLHDGLAQELAYIVSQGSRPPGDVLARERLLEELCAAASRALDESRRAIVGLTAPPDEPLATMLAEAVEQLADGSGIRLELDLSQTVRVSPEQGEALLRITSEAVRNATRHGKPGTIRVRLDGEDGMRLEVSDDGVGFDSDSPNRTPGRFGLISMRERAQKLGGELRVVSRPGAGTKVEAILP